MIPSDVPAIHYVTTTHHIHSEGFAFDVDILQDHIVLYGINMHPYQLYEALKEEGWPGFECNIHWNLIDGILAWECLGMEFSLETIHRIVYHGYEGV